MENLELKIKDLEHKEGRIYEILVQRELLERIKKSQELMIKERRLELTGDEDLSVKDEKGIRRFANRIWILNMLYLKRDILSKTHESRYLIRRGSTKYVSRFEEELLVANRIREITVR